VDTSLRLLAPFLPFATEEVWSWWREGSVHTAAWPVGVSLRGAAAGASPHLIDIAGEALGALRKIKSEAKFSQRTTLTSVQLAMPQEQAEPLELVLGDLRAAGRVRGEFELAARDVDEVLVSHHELDAGDKTHSS